MTDSHRSRRQLWGLGQLLLLGALVGLACWPLNLVDRWQDELLAHLPRFRGEPWSLHGLLIATAPLLVVPLLLWLQRGWLAAGAGSGIPQTIASLEQPVEAEELLGLKPTLARLSLWTAASLALLPLGREGPVVHVGAAVAQKRSMRSTSEATSSRSRWQLTSSAVPVSSAAASTASTSRSMPGRRPMRRPLRWAMARTAG